MGARRKSAEGRPAAVRGEGLARDVDGSRAAGFLGVRGEEECLPAEAVEEAALAAGDQPFDPSLCNASLRHGAVSHADVAGWLPESLVDSLGG